MNPMVLPDLSDREAIQQCRAGDDPDRAAFRVLYERYFDQVHRFLRRLLWGTQLAEDAAQECFLRLYQSVDRVDPERPLRPYLFKIAHNAALDVLRARKKQVQTEALIEEPAVNDRARLAAEQGELQAGIAVALRAMAPEHRTVIVLRHIEGLKLQEIAEVLSCTERTARNRLRSASVLFARELRRRRLISGEENAK